MFLKSCLNVEGPEFITYSEAVNKLINENCEKTYSLS
jgi:hypothetical protein